MFSQGTIQMGVKIVDDRGMEEIKELYRKLDLSTEETAEKNFRDLQDYWPPIPEYSVRYHTNEDLSY